MNTIQATKPTHERTTQRARRLALALALGASAALAAIGSTGSALAYGGIPGSPSYGGIPGSSFTFEPNSPAAPLPPGPSGPTANIIVVC